MSPRPTPPGVEPGGTQRITVYLTPSQKEFLDDFQAHVAAKIGKRPSTKMLNTVIIRALVGAYAEAGGPVPEDVVDEAGGLNELALRNYLRDLLTQAE